jgi:exopolyphosphatase/guanosine-5'-triphosphate,3'-diphosphate pyrophosphatase
MHLRRYNRRRLSESKEVFGAIDLGTNSCRLLVCKYDGRIRIIDSYSKVVRLGENLQESNLLSLDAMERSMKALEMCMEKVRFHHVTSLRAVTTEACRRAENSSILIARAKEELGLTLEIISNEEEALLALEGCAGIFQHNIPYGVAFDIGGGSTEIMWVSIHEETGQRHIIDWISVPYGVVTLSDQYSSHSTSPRIYDHIREKVAFDLKNFADKNNIHSYISQKKVQMVGTSGTVTTLAALFLKLGRYDRSVIDGIYLRTHDLRDVMQSILHMPQKQRNLHGCIGVGRSDLVVTGSAILEGILDAFDLSWLRVADRGVREGILSKLIQQSQRESSAPSTTST